MTAPLIEITGLEVEYRRDGTGGWARTRLQP